jgi:two-component system sensor histidine kinase/response regulator
MMQAEQPVTLAESKPGKKPLVLVVDDDRSHRKLLELLADRLEIDVHLTASCQEALAALDIFSFDVILMDCRMPDVDGYLCTQRIRELRSESSKVPIVAVTAQVADSNRKKCLNCGMDDYLAKPFSLEQLHQKLSFWLNRKHEPLLTSRQEPQPGITLA